MSDIYCEWGSDFLIGPDGDLIEAVGFDDIRQEMIRALLTNPERTLPNGTYVGPDYIFHPTFGLGLRAQIGRTITADQKNTLINKALQAAANIPEIATVPAPQAVIVQQGDPFTLYLRINITTTSGIPGVISVPLTNTNSQALTG